MQHLAAVDAQPTVIMVQGESGQLLGAEEGTFVNRTWVMTRRWNGDQVDYRSDLPAAAVLLKVRMGTYR
jgi:hypothetical protein